MNPGWGMAQIIKIILEKSQKIDFVSLISSIDRLDNGVIFIRKRGEREMMRWVGCVFKI